MLLHERMRGLFYISNSQFQFYAFHDKFENNMNVCLCVCTVHCAASVDTSYKNALRHASIFSARNLIQNAIFIRLLVSTIKYLCFSMLNHLMKEILSFYKVYKVHSTGLDSALNTYCLDDFGFLGYSKKFLTFQTFPLVKHVIDIEWEYTSVRKLSLQSLQNPFFR